MWLEMCYGLFSAEVHTGGAGIHQSSESSDTSNMLSSDTHSCITHLSQGLQWVQMLLYVCATSSPQCDMCAYVLAIQAYAHVRPVSYTHPTWICKGSQLQESIVPLKLESRSIYSGLSRMS